MIDLEKCSLPEFSEWYKEKYGNRHVPRTPRISRVVYYEHCASGIGVQINEDLFKEYLNLFKKVDGFHYRYDRLQDCTVYSIDNTDVLRLYRWGCIS